MICEIRNKYMSINIQKNETLTKSYPKVHIFKVTTLKTLSVMPHSQNSIGNWSFLTAFGNPKSD